MRRIHKRTKAPASLLVYRKTADPNRSYDGFPDKQALRGLLLEDQGELCCYCMRRIDERTMKIEHYLSQSEFPDQALDWRNLLASCDGGEGRPASEQTCDTRKGNRRLALDPRNDSVATLRYHSNGRLDSTNPDHRADIEQHLNLNQTQLTSARAQALGNLYKELRRRFGDGGWRRQDLEHYREQLRSQRPFRELLGLYEYWLQKMIARRRRGG